MKRCALIAVLLLAGCGGEQQAAAPCSPPLVHRGDAGVTIQAEPEDLRLVGTLGYWLEDWDDVERAQVFTVGNGPDGLAAKTMWSFRAPDLKGEGGSHIKLKGRNLEGEGTFEQTGSAIFYEGQNGAPSYTSTLDLPNAGCWRLHADDRRPRGDGRHPRGRLIARQNLRARQAVGAQATLEVLLERRAVLVAVELQRPARSGRRPPRSAPARPAPRRRGAAGGAR